MPTAQTAYFQRSPTTKPANKPPLKSPNKQKFGRFWHDKTDNLPKLSRELSAKTQIQKTPYKNGLGRTPHQAQK